MMHNALTGNRTQGATLGRSHVTSTPLVLGRAEHILRYDTFAQVRLAQCKHSRQFMTVHTSFKVKYEYIWIFIHRQILVLDYFWKAP